MPCDTGGLSACFYWTRGGYSPGEPADPDDELARDLHRQAQAVGWDTVWRLRSVRLHRWDAENLLLRLEWLAQYERATRRDGARDS